MAIALPRRSTLLDTLLDLPGFRTIWPGTKEHTFDLTPDDIHASRRRGQGPCVVAAMLDRTLGGRWIVGYDGASQSGTAGRVHIELTPGMMRTITRYDNLRAIYPQSFVVPAKNIHGIKMPR